ncbi:hypothetical protein HZA26_01400 [Candidatus Nomurabacteria bacterium]|nr:hypothetical protein [Candidatus Nomurabacteria bacterium]
MKSYKLLLSLAGLISGTLSSLFTDLTDIGGRGFLPTSYSNFFLPQILPGFIFGITIFTFLYFSQDLKQNFFLKLLWIPSSTFAYFIAFNTAFYTMGSLGIFSIVLAGLAGGLLMVSFFYIAYFKFTLSKIFMLTILSGLLSFAFFLTADVLFIIWQFGMALAIGTLMDFRLKNNTSGTIIT